MKIRTGFVSNSSATSFVVEYQPGKCGNIHPSRRATDDDVKKLLDYGFKFTCSLNPTVRPAMFCDSCEFNDGGTACSSPFGKSLYYDVSCNEDEPIRFLIENDIPFVAVLPYNEGIAVYMRGKESVLVIANEGERFLMHRDGNDSKSGSYIHLKHPWDKKPKTARYISKDRAENL